MRQMLGGRAQMALLALVNAPPVQKRFDFAYEICLRRPAVRPIPENVNTHRHCRVIA